MFLVAFSRFYPDLLLLRHTDVGFSWTHGPNGF